MVDSDDSRITFHTSFFPEPSTVLTHDASNDGHPQDLAPS